MMAARRRRPVVNGMAPCQNAGMVASLPARLAIIFVIPCFAAAEPAVCPQFSPGGHLPTLLNPKLDRRVTVLCNKAYAVAASGVTHGALWSAEHLTAAGISSARDTRRTASFHPDDRLPSADQGQIADYRASGYDRGHMTPSGDMPNPAAQAESFSLANVVPQTAQLNRGVWEEIESAVRGMAETEGELYLVTDPAFVGSEIQAIGPDGVLVPTSTWKAVYDPRTRGAGVYVCQNTARSRCAVVSVDQLARAVGSRTARIACRSTAPWTSPATSRAWRTPANYSHCFRGPFGCWRRMPTCLQRPRRQPSLGRSPIRSADHASLRVIHCVRDGGSSTARAQEGSRLGPRVHFTFLPCVELPPSSSPDLSPLPPPNQPGQPRPWALSSGPRGRTWFSRTPTIPVGDANPSAPSPHRASAGAPG